MKKVADWITSAETSLQACETNEAKYGEELEKTLAEYREIEKQLSPADQQAVRAIRQTIRQDTNQNIAHRIQEAAGSAFDGAIMVDAKNRVNDLLDESDDENRSHLFHLQDKQYPHLEREAESWNGQEKTTKQKSSNKGQEVR